MRLSFLGAVGGGTGSQFLLETSRARVLVDCGLFQGSPHEMAHNHAGFAFEARSLHAVVLTHAHLDHCGLLPMLTKAGYTGPILATAGTVELATLVLRDSGKLQQEQARRARRGRRDRTDHIEPLDSEEMARGGTDVESVIRAQPPAVVMHTFSANR